MTKDDVTGLVHREAIEVNVGDRVDVNQVQRRVGVDFAARHNPGGDSPGIADAHYMRVHFLGRQHGRS